MRLITKYIKKYYKLFLLAVLCVGIEVSCDLMQPTLMSIIIDKGVATKDMSIVIRYGIIMISVSLFGAIVAISRNKFAATVAQNFGAQLRADLFRKIQSFDFDNIDNFERSSLITRLTNDITNMQNFIYGLMRIFMRAPLLAIGCIIMAIRLDMEMGLIVLTIVPIVLIAMIANLKIGYPHFVKVQKALDKVNAVVREYLRGIRVVKAFNRFNYEERKFTDVNNQLANKTIVSMKIVAIFNPIITLVVNIGITIIIFIGATRVNSGSLQVGKIIAFTNYMTQLLFALMATSMIFSSLVRAKTSFKRIEEVMIEEIDIKDTVKYVKDKKIGKGVIEFNNVTFSYKGLTGEPVLKNISFTISEGMTVGIIGSTGSGKSTLINLIPRFYDINSGEIKIDNINVKSYKINELREKISIVPQRIVLFSGTVNENIRWGKKDASEQEIIEACKIADADEFILKLSHGYNSSVEQGGTNFSGGQKQRLSIARAIIKKPEILILDDSTSALDINTESKIRSTLKEYIKGMTTIIIGQKISSVQDADKIIVLDGGEIVGMGIHQELMTNCPIYQDIYKSQQ